ncbi:hypothetical protein KQI65_02005 [bacterium]|nr:hypothetical protein [bacterium]
MTLIIRRSMLLVLLMLTVAASADAQYRITLKNGDQLEGDIIWWSGDAMTVDIVTVEGTVEYDLMKKDVASVFHIARGRDVTQEFVGRPISRSPQASDNERFRGLLPTSAPPEYLAMQEERSAGLASLMSFVFPGLGQFYNEQPTKGAFMFIIGTIGFTFVLADSETISPIGAIAFAVDYFYSIIDAAAVATSRNDDIRAARYYMQYRGGGDADTQGALLKPEKSLMQGSPVHAQPYPSVGFAVRF